VSVLHNDVINWGFIDFNTNEFKIFFYILSKLDRFKLTNKDKITEEEYSKLMLKPVVLNLKDIVNDLGFGNHYSRIKDAIDKMSKTRIIIKKPDSREMFIPLLQKGTYNPIDNKGIIEIKFNQELREYLLPLGYFTESNLIPLLSFKSKYFPMFYNFLKMKSQLKNNEPILDMDNIKIVLGLDDSYVNDFHEFKRRILNKILEDFKSDYCDIIIEKYEPIRVGKKIEKIKFYIKKNSKVYKLEQSKQVNKKELNQNIQVSKETKEESSLEEISFEDLNNIKNSLFD